MRDPVLALTKAILLLAGTVSLAIGIAITFLTEGFYTSTGVDLQGNPNLYSEIRASGAVLMVVAVFLLAALFKANLRPAALIVCAVYFGAYGVARLYSVADIGWAGPEITTAMITELGIALSAIGVTMHNRRYRNW